MLRFHQFVLARPLPCIAAVLIVWIAALPGLLRLELATDGRALVAPGDPALAEDVRIRTEFGVGDELALVVESEAGLWDADTLRRIQKLSSELAMLRGVDARSVRSIATEPGDHVRPGTLDPLGWLDPFPADARELLDLRRRVERVGLYRGTLIANGVTPRAGSIVFRLEPAADRRSACADLAAWASAHSSGAQHTYLVGAPLAESRLGDHLLLDLQRLVPAAFLVLALVLFIAFRNVSAVMLPLAGVAFALTTTLGILGWSGRPVYLTLLVLPVVLAVVGIADGIHLLDDYLASRRAEPGTPRAQVLAATLARVWKPLLSAEITTALGFLSFALSPLPSVRVFGACAALGVALYVVWSLVALPALLVLLDDRLLGPGAIERSAPLRAWLGRACRRTAELALRQRVAILVATIAIAAACVLGIARVRVQDSWVDGFARTSPTYADAARMSSDFAGMHILRIRVGAQTAEARGEIGREDFDAMSVRVPFALTCTSESLAGHRLRLLPLGFPPDDPRSRPTDLRVTGVEPAGAGATRLFVRHPSFADARVADFIPAESTRIGFELSGAGRLEEPGVLQRVGGLEEFLARQTELGVGQVLGPRAHLAALNALLGCDEATLAKTLSAQRGIRQSLDLYERERGTERLREVWNADSTGALVTVLVRDANFVTVGRLFDRVLDFEAGELAPHGLHLSFGGDLAVSQSLIDGIVATQVASLAGSVATIAVLLAVMTGSVVLGLLCAVPCVLAIVLDFALMGFGGMPLGVATSMFAAMTLGVGVDWSIHLVRGVRRHIRPGVAIGSAVTKGFAEIGPAVTIDALSVAAGFAVMMASSVPPNRRLGFLLVASLLACLAATLLLLPGLLVLAGRGLARRAESNER